MAGDNETKAQTTVLIPVREAISRLERSDTGRHVMVHLLAFFDQGGLRLDHQNQEAVMSLFHAAFANGERGAVLWGLSDAVEKSA